MSAAGASQSVFDYLDRKPLQKPSGQLQPDEFRGEIEFKGVTLSYPARPDETAIQVRSTISLILFITFFLFYRICPLKLNQVKLALLLDHLDLVK